MDPTLAALLGAALGAAATAGVPVMTTRARRRDADLTARRAETANVLDVLIRLLRARADLDQDRFSAIRSEAVVATERLLLLASRRDVDELQSVLRFALESVNPRTNIFLSSAGIEAMAQVLRRWCRGELTGASIGDAYGPALDLQLDMREKAG